MELLDTAGVPAERRGYYQQLLTTVMKLHEDGALPGDLKITNTALKELRYAYKVFAPYRAVRKVTVFGSARTPATEVAAESARLFGKRMVDEGWMVVTGAGAGIMGAAQEGAGGEQSFGLNIRLPFEQEANPWIASDPKLITFKYFFTRKLFLVKEASAVALFPGGFGTMDEAYELLTLMQTGKATIVPVVLLETGPKPYWRIWDRWNRGTLVERRLVGPVDTVFYRIVDTVDDAVNESLGFYRVFHSARIVGENLVFRLREKLSERHVAETQDQFQDILKGRIETAPGPIGQELNEFPELPRLILPFNRSSYGRLRQLIDFINTLPVVA
ncbi:MAG: cytochrome D ubiquinol oxidase subunit II [Candidatus Rokuibacteriota bacterium]|nr:MAG: cytochrome D ubiquinol oxidase subunit II [Candidatus Rokubacteria bacterium]